MIKIYWSSKHNDYIFKNTHINRYYLLIKDSYLDVRWVEIDKEYITYLNLKMVVKV